MSSPETSPRKPAFAILFRYGAGEHMTFLPALEALARRLSSTHEVHHFGMRSDLEPPESLKRVLRVHPLFFRVRRQSTLDKYFKAGLWLLMLPFLALWLRARRFQGVFVDEAVPLTAPILRLFFGPRVAFTLHDFFVDIYIEPKPVLRPFGRLIKFIDRSAWRTLPLILCRVEAARRRLTAAGYRHERILVASDPCNLVLFSPGDRAAARRELGLPPDAFILVHHGVMHPNKGNDFLLRAAARLRGEMPGLLLVLVGDGPALAGLRRLAEELRCGDLVRFTGWIPDIAQVARHLHAADAAAAMRIGQPGDHFHVTSTLAHNLACGLPTLAARLDGFAEVVREDDNGLLFDPSSEEEFDRAFRRLWNDPALRARLGARARETACERFDVESVAAVMADALRSMAKGQPGNGRQGE